MSRVSIETLDHDGRFGAYLAEPAGTPRGAIVVIQEIFGVNPGIRAKCDHWASQGYLGLAPDLFWRIRGDVELDPDVPEQFQEALGLMQKLNQDKAIADIEACIRDALAQSSKKSARSALYLAPARLHSEPDMTASPWAVRTAHLDRP